MVYKWSIKGLMPVSAQVAGDELDRISKENGTLTPELIVDASRAEDAPLHKCFEWNDAVAAEKYRCVQAGNIIRLLVTEKEDADKNHVEVRAFHYVKRGYKPIDVILEDEDETEALLHKAYMELKAFRQKYKNLSALKPLFELVDKLTA